jgi:nucleoid-associated protein YgaU
VGAPASQSPATASDQSPDAGRSSYQVRLGDSLWQIAAHLLGTGADDASVAAAWPELYVANRDAIGADPDVILPGTVLQVPASLLGGTR